MKPVLETITTASTSPEGAYVTPHGVVYKVWAPDQDSMQVGVGGDVSLRMIPLQRDSQGYWTVVDPAGRAGDLYRFRFDDGTLFPDVASRFQPDGVHGASEVIDPNEYHWTANDWKRPRWSGQSIYEMHIGTFTREGTFRAAIGRLDHVSALGVEAIEIMPVADFPGNRNWGYDGVCLYAPARCYGRPDDLRALVDAAHLRGLAVLLDVVYNHLGPVGNYLSAYSKSYFQPDRMTPWGQAYDLEGPRSDAIRSLLINNAAHWLDEYRFDGFRLDATHAITDGSRLHLLAAIARVVHDRGGFLIAEDERNHVELLQTPQGGGFGFDAVWSDDFHHQVRVALTRTRESYFMSYGGTAADVAATLEHGWSYRGQSFPFWQGRPRGGACMHLPTKAFVFCIENHDQVGNRAHGERLEALIQPAAYRAASMLLCLSPYTPMLFMGQEWAAGSPFLFFTDFAADHGRLVSDGRKREFEQHGLNRGITEIPDPQAESTFTRSKLDWQEREQHQHGTVLSLYRHCLSERATWLREPALERARWRVQVSGDWVAIRYALTEGERMLIFALTVTPPLGGLPDGWEPPAGHLWHLVLCSNEAGFGGSLSGAPQTEDLVGPAAAWLVALEED